MEAFNKHLEQFLNPNAWGDQLKKSHQQCQTQWNDGLQQCKNYAQMEMENFQALTQAKKPEEWLSAFSSAAHRRHAFFVDQTAKMHQKAKEMHEEITVQLDKQAHELTENAHKNIDALFSGVKQTVEATQHTVKNAVARGSRPLKK